MIRRDLALVAEDAPELVDVVHQLATDRMLLGRMEQAGRRWVEGRELRENVREIMHLVLGGDAATATPEPSAQRVTERVSPAAQALLSTTGP